VARIRGGGGPGLVNLLRRCLDILRVFAKTARLMAEPKVNEWMEKIVSLCKRRGFVFQSSEVYGGINGFWDYGPLGAELKRNVKENWWASMTRERDDVVGLEATIIMHPKIWEASGHTSTFSDPMVDCLLTRKRFRADQVAAQSGVVHHYYGAVNRGELQALLQVDPESGAMTERSPEAASHTGTVAAGATHRGPENLLEIPDIAGAGGASVLSALKVLEQLKQLKGITLETYSVLVPAGKHPEYARKVARQYYEQRGIESPVLLGERTEEVQDSIRYNPDNGSLLTEPRPFNLMFKTYVGPVESAENVAYLRPETAQAIFVQFKNVLDVSRQKVPFGICQIGKAFRNEINPRNFTFRSREFEQMELEFFIRPNEVAETLRPTEAAEAAEGQIQSHWGWNEWHQYWVEQRLSWYESIGLTRDSLELYWQKPEELAHYARATVDILYKFPFGTQELEGIAARGNFDLSQHQKFSGKSMEYFDEEAKAKYVPHVIEPSAGVDRLILALICQAYCEEEVTDEKGKTETRVVMKFSPRIAPVKVGVFPLLKNRPELVQKARAVQDLLRPHMTVFYDEAGAIGRRYRRQDEAGTPFGVTIDFDTLGETPDLKDTVTLRDRDTMQQTRVRLDELVPLLLEKIR
jgi:glycyl-tRNA synthetase